METIQNKDKKGMFVGRVRGNTCLTNQYYRLILEFHNEAAKTFESARPGQFVQIKISELPLPNAESIPAELKDSAYRQSILRRPISFADIESEESGCTRVEFLYKAVGPGTLRISALCEGDAINLIGPLGNGFWVPNGKRAAILVAGGMGAPPLKYLARFLTRNYADIKTEAMVGVRTAIELPFAVDFDELSKKSGKAIKDFSKFGINTVISTDDGSAGVRGFVTECLEKRLGGAGVKSDELIIYACGPEQMLARVAEIARKHDIDCQVCMERMMGCGIGVCQSCAVEVKADGKETVYQLCCKDGPVFESKKVVWQTK